MIPKPRVYHLTLSEIIARVLRSKTRFDLKDFEFGFFIYKGELEKFVSNLWRYSPFSGGPMIQFELF